MPESPNPQPEESAALKRILAVAAAIVGAEALVMFAFSGWLWLDVFTGQSRWLAMAISLAGVVTLASMFLVFVGLRLLENRRWSRSAALFWQTCQLAVASASFTGRFSSVAIGVALIVPSVAVIVLLFTRPVLRAAKAELESE